MKSIVIAGGTGFLGQALENYFSANGDQVSILTRNPSKDNHQYWDAKTFDGNWASVLNDADVLINLCGKSVDCRYTDKNKKAILQSRIVPTTLLNKAMDMLPNPPSVWINASSATIYDESFEKLMTEENGTIGDDFSMSVCKAWEDTFNTPCKAKIRKVACRISIVLGKDGGAFPKFKLLSKLGFGGIQGNGKQMVSWVHISDFCRSMDFIIQNPKINGAINITAPIPINNESFCQSLKEITNAIIAIGQPKWLIELGAFFIRTEPELLLKSRNVYPEKLNIAGFEFQYAKISNALKDLID